jgi:hypothetical protein
LFHLPLEFFQRNRQFTAAFQPLFPWLIVRMAPKHRLPPVDDDRT